MIFYIALALGLFLFILLFNSVYLVQQAQVVIVERLGKFHRILGPGLHFIIPFLDNPRSVTWTFLFQEGRRHVRYIKILFRIDLREAVYDFPKQNVITKDNVTMEINALLYYQIFDPKAAIYAVLNLPEAIEKLTQTTLRNVIGSMDLEETLVSRSSINEKLRIILDEATDKWGVKVNRVELLEVNPPEDIRQAMEKQMRAERDKRAAILEAEGAKRSAILNAEGVKESQVLRASGEAEARIQVAAAEAQAINLVKGSLPGDPAPYLITQQYMKMLPEMTKGKNDKMIILPYEASALIGSLASIKKVFEDIK
ncbi:SPFH/Band 7/PHB domain protein [Candidatus Dependentiae bacterium]|nr:SPFH/Band 7/PHB domain protein [Candidatus Dependentiae bacterium]